LAEQIQQADEAIYDVDPPAERFRIESLQRDAASYPYVDPTSLATLDRLSGMLKSSAGNFDEASADYDRGIARLTIAGLTEGDAMARLLVAKAAIEQQNDHLSSARALAQKAEAMLIRLHGTESPELIEVQCALGLIDYLEGRLSEAIEHYQMGLSHSPVRARDHVAHASLSLDLAVFSDRYGDSLAMMRYARQALVEAQAFMPAHHSSWGAIYSNSASFYTGMGRFDEAAEFAQRAIDFCKERFGEVSFELGNSQRFLAIVRLRQGRLDEALHLIDLALANLRVAKIDAGNRFVEGDTYRALARTELARHHPQLAEAAVRKAFASLARNHVKTGFEALLNYELALAQTMAGRYTDALASVDKALDSLRKRRAPYETDRTNAETLRARILARLGRTTEAWTGALVVGQAMTARLADLRVGQRVLASSAVDYRVNFGRLAEIAVAAHQNEAAFRYAQLAAYSELASSSVALAARAAAANPEAAAHVRALQDMQVQLDHLERRRNFALASGGSDAAKLSAQITTSETAVAREADAVRQTFPGYDALTQAQPEAPDTASRALKPGEALLLLAPSDDRLAVLVLSQRGLTATSSALDSVTLKASVQRIRSAIDQHKSIALSDSWALGRHVFGPTVLKALSGIRELSVVGSGPLMTLPLGMLLTAPPVQGGLRAQPYAIRKFALAVRPQLTQALVSNKPTSSAFLGVGAPALGPAREWLRSGARLAAAKPALEDGIADVGVLLELASLPGSAGELQKIARSIPAPGNRVLTGQAATEAAFRAEPLDAYGVIAFATHGLVSGELEGLNEPALVLTPPAGKAVSSDNDGLLTASEIAGLHLNARWVILSACNTGAGIDAGAAGYSGLARSFIQAGAQSLLVSLWPVRDDAAARLSADTVRYATHGMTQARALRRATLDLIADRSIADGGNPAVWAPFSLVRQ